ncbi:MAG TPA: PhoPQ-activated protein PqaA family protein [Fimbriimonadaceae bacterium]|nr:PhoPQ-activated protein PqaA family protein [Fimbriimonadaceae bacterium]
MLSALVACLAVMSESVPPELDAYLKRPDSSFAWSKKEPGLASLHIRMTSQTWRNVRWTHDIVLTKPAKPAKGDTAILYITGGEPNKADLAEAQKLADLAKMPVAHLFQIPNQPLFGMNEDDLIAHTFEQFLKAGETDWPLLFPMVKSAIRAMDTLVTATASSPQPLKRFVVTGASKRGWTAWFAGAANDSRVIGIAPMVFDNLNMKPQLEHQLKSWGKYSEMIADYTDRGLDKILDTPPGKKLVAMVDPYAYRSRITMPKMIVNGSNDRYWTVDALSLYWNELPGPKYLSIVPNAGHLLGDMNQALNAIAVFAKSVVRKQALPRLTTYLAPDRRLLSMILDDLPKDFRFVDGGFWIAQAPTADFREAVWKWQSTPFTSTGHGFGQATWVPPKSKEGRIAVLGMVEVDVQGQKHRLSIPVQVF